MWYSDSILNLKKRSSPCSIFHRPGGDHSRRHHRNRGGMITRPILTFVGTARSSLPSPPPFDRHGHMAVSNLTMHRLKGGRIEIKSPRPWPRGVSGVFSGPVSSPWPLRILSSYIVIMTLVFLLVYFKVYLPDILITPGPCPSSSSGSSPGDVGFLLASEASSRWRP